MFDNWKTTDTESEAAQIIWNKWLDASESLTRAEMREEMYQAGIIDSYTQKLDKPTWETWVQWKVTQDE